MELKFLLITFLVLFAAFGSIESGRGSSGRSSSSRSSSSRSSSSRSSSSYKPSSSSGWGSSSNKPSSSSGWGSSSNKPSSSSGWGSPSSHRGGSTSHNTGSFLNSERTHVSNTGSSNYKPPTRPFGTVPPPRQTGSSNYKPPTRPFGTVPPPRQTGGNNHLPLRPFGTVPPPRNNGIQKPTPPPAGFVIPNGSGSPTRPFVPVPGINSRPTVPPVIHPATRPPPVSHPRPGSHSGLNRTTGFHPPAPGFKPPITPVSPPIQPTHYPTQGSHFGSSGSTPNYPRQPPFNPAVSRPGSHSGLNRTTGFLPPAPGFKPPITQPPAPIQPTHYPTQGSHFGGSGPTHNYPRQPPFNPSVIPPSAPVFSPYPGHHPTQTWVQPSQTHIHHNYAPTHPQLPAQTVVVVPGSGGYSRTTGDIFKEALIHAGVNAAVNRLTSPSHYYGHDYHNSWSNYGPPPSGQSTHSSTQTHITNNYYYDQNAGGSSNGAIGSNPPPNYNPQLNPGGGVQGGSSNGFSTPGNFGTNVNNGNNGAPGSTSSPGHVGSQPSTNGNSSPSQNNGNGQPNSGTYVPVGIQDQEIFNITEKLFSLDENSASEFIKLNLQKQIEKNNTNITDLSPQPLFVVDEKAYNIPTIKAIRSLYQADLEIKNNTRLNSRKEEALFVDLILNTNVMIAAMDFLARKNLISTDYYAHKDMLKHIWFTPYDGSSSGFKRVFQGDMWEGILWGIQDWIAFDFQEKAKHANYFSYSQKLDLGKSAPKASILKVNFEIDGNLKAGTQLFVGTSPELQIALYTICAYTRPFYSYPYCNVSLGGTQFPIYTHTDRYSGKDLINAAFPLILE